jgi:hypothetical protein
MAETWEDETGVTHWGLDETEPDEKESDKAEDVETPEPKAEETNNEA